jgi:hypothetical protein
MDVHYSNGSSSDGSGNSGSSYDEDVHVGSQERDSINMIQPYAFEPVESDSSGEHVDSEEMASASSSSSGQTTRLQDTNW